MGAENDFYLPSDDEFEQEHSQLVDDLGHFLMSHSIAKTSSFHSFAALSRVAMKALINSGAGCVDAENIWKTAFATLYPQESEAYSDYVRKLAAET